jgi:hypothetical protein
VPIFTSNKISPKENKMLTQPFSQEQSIYSLGAAQSRAKQTQAQKYDPTPKNYDRMLQASAMQLANSKPLNAKAAMALLEKVGNTASVNGPKLFEAFANIAEKTNESRLIAAAGSILGAVTCKQQNGNCGVSTFNNYMSVFKDLALADPTIIKNATNSNLLDLSRIDIQSAIILFYLCPSAKSDTFKI